MYIYIHKNIIHNIYIYDTYTYTVFYTPQTSFKLYNSKDPSVAGAGDPQEAVPAAAAVSQAIELRGFGWVYLEV